MVRNASSIVVVVGCSVVVTAIVVDGTEGSVTGAPASDVLEPVVGAAVSIGGTVGAVAPLRASEEQLAATTGAKAAIAKAIDTARPFMIRR